MRSTYHFKDLQNHQYHGQNSIWSKLKFHKKHHQHLKPQQKHHLPKLKQLQLKEKLHQLLKVKPHQHHQQNLHQHQNQSLKLSDKLLNLANMFLFVTIRNTSSLEQLIAVACR